MGWDPSKYNGTVARIPLWADDYAEQSKGVKPAMLPRVTKQQFREFMKTSFEHRILPTCDDGQAEYAHASESAFANFESVAEETGCTKEQALWTYFLKHKDGISSWLKGHKSQRESVRGRIKDAIVYLFLLDAMVVQAEGEE